MLLFVGGDGPKRLALEEMREKQQVNKNDFLFKVYIFKRNMNIIVFFLVA